ncbi:MAG: acyloxyacyl hydrolase [Flavobacteriaceae bacterium]|nr:acyloxyacyl hydrolase [Flavobacteriaceae bacterium]
MRYLFAAALCLWFTQLSAQDLLESSTVDVSYFKGNIALHNDGILHLITGHPEGLIVAWNKKTFGDEAWHQRYNYPDYGISLSYQDLKTEALGHNLGIYGHFNFYFFDRNLMFRIGQGMGWTSNPYDRVNNTKNNAFGSSLMSSTYAMLKYRKERLFHRFGIQAGLTTVHYSNANVKAPNTSVNSVTASLGIIYNLDEEDQEYRYDLTADEKFTEAVRYNFVFRSGINESDVVGMGQYPFYIFSAYADKRINHKSALQAGTDIFFSNFLKELITFKSIAFPEDNVDPDSDYKRVGIFLGHELFINKLTIVTQFGYYIYYPFDFEGRVYQRIGLKRYFGDQWFGAITLKSHAAKAEAVEFGIGIRL